MAESNSELIYTRLKEIHNESDLLGYIKKELGAFEAIHYDFKEKRDRRNASLDDDDKKNIAKGVSGFANSDGGVLIWGIEDNSLAPKPISNVEGFAREVLAIANACVTPMSSGVDAFIILSNEGNKSGFLILHVPKSSHPPHQVILKIPDVQRYYFVRNAGSFNKAEHYQLEDLFGRRPAPKLTLSYLRCERRDENEYKFIMEIHNIGAGTAKNVYLAVAAPDTLAFDRIDGDCDEHGIRSSALFPTAKRIFFWEWAYLHPGMSIQVQSVGVNAPPKQLRSEFEISYQFFAEGMMSTKQILSFVPQKD